MVRASVSFNTETKLHEWKVTSDGCSTVLQITTPAHNLCILRNYPYFKDKPQETTTFKQYFDYSLKLEKLKSTDIINFIDTMKKEYPLSFHFWVSNTYHIIFHPVKDVCFEYYCYVSSMSIEMLRTLCAIHTDMLNYVLEFDRQCRRDQLLEHQLLRNEFKQDMSAIVQGVPVQSENSGCECILDDKTGRCKFKYVRPDVPHLHRY